MRKRRVHISFILAAVVILLNLPVPSSMRVRSTVRDQVAPFQNVLHAILTSVSNAFASMTQARAVLSDKEKMLEELAVLREKLREMEGLDKENEQLREQLDVKKRSRRKLVLCEVVGRGGSAGWWRVIRINKGAKHGIRPNMAVITKDGLIGRTGGPKTADPGCDKVEISRLSSDVLLITDPNCQVACELSRTGAFGILRGGGVSMRGEGKIEMLYPTKPTILDYVPRHIEVQVNDPVVTSGLGGVFPKGLPVGYVVRTRMDESGLYQRAEIRPAANLDQLRYVFVVIEE